MLTISGFDACRFGFQTEFPLCVCVSLSLSSNSTHGRSTPRDDLVAQTPLIPTDSLIVEVYVTSGDHEQVEVIASSVVHSFRNVFQLMQETQKVNDRMNE